MQCAEGNHTAVRADIHGSQGFQRDRNNNPDDTEDSNRDDYLWKLRRAAQRDEQPKNTEIRRRDDDDTWISGMQFDSDGELYYEHNDTGQCNNDKRLCVL